MPALEFLDGAAVRRWCAAAADALGAAREQINALNVFPVADRDTGTNLHLTMLSATRALGEMPPEAGTREVWQALAHGILLGAQGNSGVIISQFMRGLADTCAPASRCDGPVVREGLAHAARLSRAAVGQPVEGTVLTVADAAAAAVGSGAPAAALAGGGVSNGLPAVTAAAADGARRALMRTTAQLDVLARAGVVDAGAAGLCLILDALAAVVAETVAAPATVPCPAVPSPAVRSGAVRSGAVSPQVRPGDGEHGPASGERDGDPAGYEVMYLLEAADAEVARLRDRLGNLGDSVVVVGGDGVWNVHVHVADAGAAIEAGMAAGRPRRIRVNYLAPSSSPAHVAGRCAADEPGLADHDALTAHDEMPGSPDGRASRASGGTGFGGALGAMASAATATRWGEVLWLPAENTGAATDPETAAAATDAESAAAATDAETAGLPPHGAGNAVGRIGDDVVATGADATAVAVKVAERLLAAGGDLVALIAGSFPGAGVPDGGEVADVVAARLEETRPGLEITIHEGGRVGGGRVGGEPGYLLAIGVGRVG